MQFVADDMNVRRFLSCFALSDRPSRTIIMVIGYSFDIAPPSS